MVTNVRQYKLAIITVILISVLALAFAGVKALETICSDDTDNDGDFDTDCADSDCNGKLWGTRTCPLGSSGSCDQLCIWTSTSYTYGDCTLTCTETNCADGIDNDADTFKDCKDSDCNGIGSCEYGTEVTCNDAKDNDGDGATDMTDQDCISAMQVQWEGAENWESKIPIYVKELKGIEHQNGLIEVKLDTYSLINDGLMQADCDDIRLIDYKTEKLLLYEVSNCDSKSTKIRFRADVSANYDGILALIYYNNMDASSASTTVSSWVAKADMNVPRFFLASAAYDDKIYTLGGITTFVVNNNEIYDPADNSWSSKEKMQKPLQYAAATTLGSRIYIAGGNSDVASKSLYSYIPASNTWNAKADMSITRERLALESANGKLYAIGGWSGNAMTAKVEEYNPETNIWNSSKKDMPTARIEAASAVVNDKIYVIGGQIANGASTSKVEMYDPSKNNWTARADMPVARRNAQAVVLNDKIYVLGGGDTKNVYVYDPGKNTWTTDEDMPVTRSFFAAESVGGKIYVFGGSGTMQRTDEYSASNIGLNVSLMLSTKEVCDGFDNDNDDEIDEGGVCNTVSSCGSFNHSCLTEHVSNATCEEAVCAIIKCKDKYYDVDLDAENGCEYYCVISNNGTEIIDNKDNDCDGTIDLPVVDEDNDNYNDSVDCDDSDSKIHPNATEKCDGIDNDCDRIKDEGCPGDSDNIFDQTLATSFTIGNGKCEAGEDESNAPIDCGCLPGKVLVGNTCKDPGDLTDSDKDTITQGKFVTKDGACDKAKGETKENSPEDCKTPVGKYVAIILAIAGIGALGYYAYEHLPRRKLDLLTEEHEVSEPSESSASSVKGYIESCQSKGFSNDKIRDALLKKGWDEDKIDQYLE